MTTESFESTPATAHTSSANPIARLALQILGVVAAFVAAYLLVESLLRYVGDDAYSAGTAAVRIGIGLLAALVAAGALRVSKRFS